jgi:hypothetical protein
MKGFKNEIMIELNKLKKQLDEALEKETKESLTKFLNTEREESVSDDSTKSCDLQHSINLRRQHPNLLIKTIRKHQL